jgi:hypothetical protein
MKKRFSSDELRTALRRALAYGYAALEEPTTNSIREAQRIVSRVLAAHDQQLLRGEIAELAAALRRVANQLTGHSPQTA